MLFMNEHSSLHKPNAYLHLSCPLDLDSLTLECYLHFLNKQQIHKVMTKNHGPHIKNDEQYEALRDKGMSKSKAARIANTQDSGQKGGKAEPYEEWTKDDLYDKAKKVGIEGRSKMNKSELIQSLRSD